MHVPPRRADAPLFSARAVVRALAVGAVALAAVVLVQWLGYRSGWSDPTLRLAALATIVVGNLAMLQWFRGGPRADRGGNTAFDLLLLGVCALSLAVLLLPRLSAAFGFPANLDMRWTSALLGVPAVWALWRIAVSAHRRRAS
jgi:Ca2+-transporting ATPase